MTDREFKTPEAAERAFYGAFSATDLDLMGAVWSDGKGVLCIHPGSALLQGKPAIMQSWKEIFSSGEPPTIEYRFIDGFETEELVVRVVEEKIRPRGSSPGAATRVLATNVFVRSEGAWYLVEHHASLPLMERENAKDSQRQLH